MKRLDEGTSQGWVGRSPPRTDGADKVTGRARYLDDLHFEGQLWGKTIRSTIPHGRIKSITFDPAFDWTGITRVTAEDIPGDNVVHLIQDDQPYLARDVVRHHDEPIALLACADRERLEEAARHVYVIYERQPPMLDALASQQIFKSYRIEKEAGQLGSLFEQADRIVEGTYVVRHQEQLYIEPNAVCAVPRGDGGVTLYGSMQCPFYVQRALMRVLKITDQQLAVIQTITGGGFGGKEEYPSMIAGHAALLARKANAPVKIIYGRDEDLSSTTKRHPAVIRHRTAVKRDGTLLATEIDITMDGGAYCTLSPVVLSRGAIHAAGPYRWQAVRIDARVVGTHTPPNGAFRGFGAPQTLFAVEAQMERIARELQLDPVEIRRKNALVLGDRTATGQLLKNSVSALEVLDKGLERSDFLRKREEYAAWRQGAKRRGIGLSLVLHGAGFTGSGEVKLKAKAGVELTAGGARVLAASTEIGQGTNTIFAQMAADALGLSLEQIEVAVPDTSKVPDSGPTVASRTAMVVGGTITKAARGLERVLAGYAAELHQLPPETVRCLGGNFYAGTRGLGTWTAFAKRYLETRGPLRMVETYSHPEGIVWDDETYVGDAYPAYAWACNVVELEVDLDTYETSVLNVVTVNDVGKALHPVLCEGQIEGGLIQALGYALLEEVIHKDGRVMNPRLQNYIIPTALDAPPIQTVLVENPYPDGPYGAKGVGELPMDVAAPAVVAAIHDATGVWIHDLPATPERILAALAGIPGPPVTGVSQPLLDAGSRPVEANREAPAEGLDPRPDAPTDPQPLRGPDPRS